MDNESSQVANPGSTLGEAVGALIEDEVKRVLRPVDEENGCVFVTAGRPKPRSATPTKLKLNDAAGNEYQTVGFALRIIASVEPFPVSGSPLQFWQGIGVKPPRR